ncbi:MAG TPA: PAS domain S-box protein [Casimicrobiaceae bacterium]|jgi:PAS domain S-box-containing protein
MPARAGTGAWDAAGRRADRYAQLCEFLPWGYLVLDEATRIEEANPAAAALLGRPEGRLLGASLQTWLSNHCVEALLDALSRSVATGLAQQTPLELRSRDGRTRNVDVHVQRFGPGTRYRVALLDVTEIRRANLALRGAVNEMRDLYQNAPCGYHSLDAEGVIVQINDTELRWLGYARDELVHKVKLTELMSGGCRAEFEAAFVSLKNGGQVRDLEVELRRSDTSVLPVLLSATALIDSTGQFLESRASVFDITRRKIAEEEASRYAERLKGMARRAAEVQEVERRALGRELHDRVGQNLTALNINLNILKGALPTGAPAALRTRLDDSLALVDGTVESMRDVMTELRPAVLDDYGLAAMLHWYAEESGRRTGMSIAVEGRDPAPRLAPPVERALFRIVQESLTNVAKHAGARRVTLRLEPGDHSFRLSVIDDGCGFDADAPERSGDHHGWGLMIMRERAEAVGGRMRVRSAAGRGTDVTVELAR